MDSIVYCNECTEHAKNLLAFPLWEKGMQRAWMDEWLINFPRHFFDSKKCVSLLPCLHDSDTAWMIVQITEYKFTLGTVSLIDSSWTVTMLVIFLHSLVLYYLQPDHGTFVKQHISLGVISIRTIVEGLTMDTFQQLFKKKALSIKQQSFVDVPYLKCFCTLNSKINKTSR